MRIPLTVKGRLHIFIKQFQQDISYFKNKAYTFFLGDVNALRKWATYEIVKQKLAEEFGLCAEENMVLLNMENGKIDEKTFNVLDYVQKNKKYVGTTRLYLA